MTYLIASGIAAASGIASGFFGIGGGIIMIPSLIFFLGMTQTQAAATSLAAMLLPVGLFGVMTYWKAGNLPAQNFYIAAILAAGLLFGAPLGAKLALLLKEEYLRKAFAGLLIFAAVKLLFK